MCRERESEMPVLIPLAVAAIGGGIAASQSGGGGSSSAAVTQQLNAAKLQQVQQNELASQKAIQANLANAQEQGGGALSNPGLLGLGASIAGVPGDVGNASGQNALNAYLGVGGAPAGAGGTSGGTGTGAAGGPGGLNLNDIVQRLLAGGGSGGGGGDNMVGATYGLSGNMG
jgi:hypothetical protein